MRLMLQKTKFQVQVLKPCKPVQESSQKVQDFKAQQLARQLASIEVLRELFQFETRQLLDS